MKKLTEQKSFHVKTGDDVVVIAGGGKGRFCRISRVNRKKLVVFVEGTDARSKGEDEGTKALKDGGANAHELDRFRLIKPQLHYIRKNQQNPNGALLWLEGPIHISNVMKVSEFQRRRLSKQ